VRRGAMSRGEGGIVVDTKPSGEARLVRMCFLFGGRFARGGGLGPAVQISNTLTDGSNGFERDVSDAGAASRRRRNGLLVQFGRIRDRVLERGGALERRYRIGAR